jgi:hypothetical protein
LDTGVDSIETLEELMNGVTHIAWMGFDEGENVVDVFLDESGNYVTSTLTNFHSFIKSVCHPCVQDGDHKTKAYGPEILSTLVFITINKVGCGEAESDEVADVFISNIASKLTFIRNDYEHRKIKSCIHSF